MERTAAKMTCKGWRLVAWILALAGAVPFCVGFFSGHFWSSPLSWVGIVVLVVSAAVGACKFRCPHCGRHLSDQLPLSVTHCPHCGGALEPEKDGPKES